MAKITFANRFVMLIMLILVAIILRPATERRSVLDNQQAGGDITPRDINILTQDIGNTSLLPRAAYDCGPSKPCSNGACCGGSGYCGYGSAYCGTGCVSNCDATAECGKHAKQPGKECPLKTCCSEHGFCGTTEDFCGAKCQSNCVLNPKPSGSRAPSGILQNKVIGYYESWSARKACHKVSPKDLPLDALTHVNFAFAYISPETYQLVPMDSSTPSSLFQETTDIKSIKHDIAVWISVGGWTFSDNGTDTQALFGEISADASKRQTFADNVVRFMRQYGFDGIDVDWEYPGAPDRGGKPEDVANFVALFKTLRETFDASGNKFGLTFTVPSSYWYLQWFDLPGLMKYADWVNLMSYDLHGSWDASNPIGSIVQGHTNLTEIKLAAELLWRANIPPAKVVLGFGFYGRSFTLSDPSCTKPGCPFKSASKPGPCSATGGILAYYEIKDIIAGSSNSKRDAVSPTHDKSAAVNYFTFDEDQWISYDDTATFKQKVDWANSIGLGGSMIWASDLDDDKHSAHSALLGRNVKSTQSLPSVELALSNPQAVIQEIAGSNGQNCFAFKKECVNLDDKSALARACGSGFTVVGWDDAGCGKKNHHYGKPICCPVNEAPSSCTWRGNNNGGGIASDCNAQCAAGETNIQSIGSSWGGGFENDGNTNKCGRGHKVFCCVNPDFRFVVKGCHYAKCGSKCKAGETSLFRKTDGCGLSSQQYCCPSPVQLKDCHWTGGSAGQECSNARCSATEVEIDRAQFGDGHWGGCSWGRKKAACCTVQKAPPKPATCSADLCKLVPGLCRAKEAEPKSVKSEKRDSNLLESSLISQALEKRGEAQRYEYGDGGPGVLFLIAAAFPVLAEIYGLQNAAQVLRSFFRMIRDSCFGNTVEEGPIPPGTKPDFDFRHYQAEHIIDRQIMKHWMEAVVSGTLKSKKRAHLPPLDRALFVRGGAFHIENVNLGKRPPVGGPNGAQPDIPEDRIMEGFGTYDYPYPLMAVEDQINGAKGRVMACRVPVTIDRIRNAAREALRMRSRPQVDALLTLVRSGYAVFDYTNRPNAAVRFNAVRQQVRLQMGYVEEDLNIPNLVAWWDLFTGDYFEHVETVAQQWATRAIAAAGAPFQEAYNNDLIQNDDELSDLYEQVMAALEDFTERITGMRLPPDTSTQNPQDPGGVGDGDGDNGDSDEDDMDIDMEDGSP